MSQVAYVSVPFCCNLGTSTNFAAALVGLNLLPVLLVGSGVATAAVDLRGGEAGRRLLVNV